MNAPELLPPRDLLSQVYGVERGLRRGRRARLLGVLIAAVQITILLANSSWVSDLLAGDWDAVFDQWPLIISLFLLVLSVLLVSWTRFWLRESKQPFQYTYSVATFEPLTGEKAQPLLAALHADIRERLSLRIRRLSLLENVGDDPDSGSERQREGAEEARASSHVHVTGQYARRKRPPDDRWFVEITPWVRVGGPDQPATLGVPVKYALDAKGPGNLPPALDREEYERILERTYFSIATEVYRQIKEDVSRKIDLLPSRWFRATALFYEAEDYARSNTLDAYEQARELYAATLDIYDPGSAALPKSVVRRPWARVRRRARLGLAATRRGLSWAIPRFGRSEVLAARAQVGYANTLLDVSVLAPLSGLRARAVYEAAPIAGRARKRLTKVGIDVPGRKASLFDAEVALALATAQLSAPTKARKALKDAGAGDPQRAETDPRYLFVRALLAGRLLSELTLFQRAVEQAPRFEAAQFRLAQSSEMLWRTRPKLEPNVAKTVLEQYGEVLKLNPGNIAAWSNCGYMWWLLKDLDEAKRYLDGGRRFKEIKREAYVAEVDHGLARVAAEQGDFERAYHHYILAVSARIAHGWATGSYDEYHFEFAGQEILTRFKGYCDTVEDHCNAAEEEEPQVITERVRKSVHAFALYDYSQACYRYYLRTYDYTVLENGYRACKRALDLNEHFVLAAYQLYVLATERARFVPSTEAPGTYLDMVETLEPGWPEAALAQLSWHDEEAGRARQQAEEAERQAAEKRAEAAQLEIALSDPREETGWADESESKRAPASPGPDPAGYDRLRELEQQISGLTAEAEDHRENAKNRDAKARELPRKLLPHRWLWKNDDFDWRSIGGREAGRELRWERSFEEFHVTALFAWCKFLSDKPEGKDHVDGLLDLIEERFWPTNLELLSLRLERTGQNETYRASMDEFIQFWLTQDDYPFAALSWLDPTSEKTCTIYSEFAARKDLSPYLSHWLGQQLLARWRLSLEAETADKAARDGALVALERAKEIEQPDVLLDVANGLRELDQLEESERLYLEAAAASEEPRQLTALAEQLESAGNFSEALDVFERAQASEPPEADQNLRSRAYYGAALGANLFALGRYREAYEAFAQPPGPEGERISWPVVAERLRNDSAIGSRDAHFHLRCLLGAAQRRALVDGDETAAMESGTAAIELADEEHARPMWRPLEAEAEAELRSPYGWAIVVQAHADYFPQDKDTPAVPRMINEDIPRIREAIQGETGVFIPGFRIRSSFDVAPHGYSILIDDMEVRSGLVPDGLNDPYAFILERTADAIRGRLSTFLDLQSVETLVEQWSRESQPEARGALVARALGDVPRQRALVSLLKLLVDDGVPVDDLGPPLKVLADKWEPGCDLYALADEVRRASRERLRGQSGPRITLPEELEAEIAESMPANELWPDEEHLAAVRVKLQELHTDGDAVTLVVSSPDHRAAVRRLVDLDWPGTPVLSKEELVATSPDLTSRLVSKFRP